MESNRKKVKFSSVTTTFYDTVEGIEEMIRTEVRPIFENELLDDDCETSTKSDFSTASEEKPNHTFASLEKLMKRNNKLLQDSYKYTIGETKRIQKYTDFLMNIENNLKQLNRDAKLILEKNPLNKFI